MVANFVKGEWRNWINNCRAVCCFFKLGLLIFGGSEFPFDKEYFATPTPTLYTLCESECSNFLHSPSRIFRGPLLCKRNTEHICKAKEKVEKGGGLNKKKFF